MGRHCRWHVAVEKVSGSQICRLYGGLQSESSLRRCSDQRTTEYLEANFSRGLTSCKIHNTFKNTALQRRHTNGEQIHENMFSITNHHGSKDSNVGAYVEQRELSHTVGGNVRWCSHCGASHEACSRRDKCQLKQEYFHL